MENKTWSKPPAAACMSKSLSRPSYSKMRLCDPEISVSSSDVPHAPGGDVSHLVFGLCPSTKLTSPWKMDEHGHLKKIVRFTKKQLIHPDIYRSTSQTVTVRKPEFLPIPQPLQRHKMGIRRKLASWRLFRRPHRSPR